MSEFEKVTFVGADDYAIYFEVEENHLLIEFEEKLRQCDIVLVDKQNAKKMFDQQSGLEVFAREHGFTTRWDVRQNCFICTKEPPWIE